MDDLYLKSSSTKYGHAGPFLKTLIKNQESRRTVSRINKIYKFLLEICQSKNPTIWLLEIGRDSALANKTFPSHVVYLNIYSTISIFILNYFQSEIFQKV